MTATRRANAPRAFSLAEVVMAIGIVSFSVLATVGLLSVASDTQRRAKDDASAARLASNEFERLRSLSASSEFWTTTPPLYPARYYDSGLADLGPTNTANAIYELSIIFSAAPAGTADLLADAEVRYPAAAPTPNQNVARFTALMNIPVATPTPTATPGP